MPTRTTSKDREFAKKIVQASSEPERAALLKWGEELLRIRNSSEDAAMKATQAIDATTNEKVAMPILQLVGREAKRVGWDERNVAERAGLSAATVGLLLLSATGAGVAAIGGAFGVPLWVVFGSGGQFMEALVEELRAARSDVIDPMPMKAAATGPRAKSTRTRSSTKTAKTTKTATSTTKPRKATSKRSA